MNRKKFGTRFIDSLILATVLFVGVVIASVVDTMTQGVSWFFIPQIRLIAHAVAALVIATFFTTLFYSWMIVITELLGLWVIVITSPFKRIGRKVRMILRKLIFICMGIIQPYMGAIIYIAHSYEWETMQAIEYNRAVQLDQFLVDIVFSMISGIIWRKIFNETLPFYWYEFSAKEILPIAIEIREELDDYEYVDRRSRILGHISRNILRMIIAVIPILAIFATVFICNWILSYI